MPTVTVLMAVYNGERWLREAMEGILAQSFRDFEFVIVDDGSTDRSREIVASYGDPRICLLANDTNLGLTRSLNRGLEASEGELVARQDADDVAEPTRLARQVAYLDAHPEIAVLGSWYTKIGPDGAPLGLRRLPTEPTDLRWAMLFYCPLVHSAVIFRRAAVARATGFYDERFSYAQDYELWSRVVRRLPAANLPEYLLRLRMNPSSMTATYGERTLEGPEISLAAIGALLGREPPFDPARWLAALQTLLLRTGRELSTSDLLGSLPDLLDLHRAFCADIGLNDTAAASRDAGLRGEVARRLVELAAGPGARAAAERRQLLAAAWSLRPGAVLSVGGLRALAAGGAAGRRWGGA